MSASDLAGNALEQAGLSIKNQSEQKTFDHLGTVQKQQDDAAAMGLDVSRANIRSSDASVNSSNASAKNSIDAISERGLARLERTKLDNDTTLLLKMSQDPKYANPDGSANMGMLTKDLQAAGVPLKNIVAGMGGVDTLGRRDELKATASLAAANKETRSLASFNDTLKNNSANRTAAIDAIGLNVDKDVTLFGGLFGEDSQYNEAMANIKSAAATTYVDASGNTKTVSPNVLNDLVKSSSDSAGDLLPNRFNDKFKALISQLAKEK